MKWLKLLIAFLWQLPQSALGLLVMSTLTRDILKVDHLRDTVLVVNLSKGAWLHGVSLGIFIFIREDVIKADSNVVYHEFGHVKQSWLLGWTYLFVIGIPSYVNFLRSKKSPEYREKYYTVYPERWADKWGGVER